MGGGGGGGGGWGGGGGGSIAFYKRTFRVVNIYFRRDVSIMYLQACPRDKESNKPAPPPPPPPPPTTPR